MNDILALIAAIGIAIPVGVYMELTWIGLAFLGAGLTALFVLLGCR